MQHVPEVELHAWVGGKRENYTIISAMIWPTHLASAAVSPQSERIDKSQPAVGGADDEDLRVDDFSRDHRHSGSQDEERAQFVERRIIVVLLPSAIEALELRPIADSRLHGLHHAQARANVDCLRKIPSCHWWACESTVIIANKKGGARSKLTEKRIIARRSII